MRVPIELESDRLVRNDGANDRVAKGAGAGDSDFGAALPQSEDGRGSGSGILRNLLFFRLVMVVVSVCIVISLIFS